MPDAMLDAVGFALSLLAGALGAMPGSPASAPATTSPALPAAAFPAMTLLAAPDRLFHPRERAVGDWRWQAAANLDASAEQRAAILFGRDPAGVPRCVKLNNYWCIKRGGWSGEIAADADGHVAFASAADGAAVAALLLRRYYVDYGRRSTAAIVSRWAPASCAGPALPAARRSRADRAVFGGFGRTLRARWLAAHGHRAAGGRTRGRASSVPDPLIGALFPSPTIALGLGAAPASFSAALPATPAAALPAPLSRAGSPGSADAVRIRNYAARAAAGIAASPDADLALCDGAGRPTPHLAHLLRNMAAVEIGPFGAGEDLVAAAVAAVGGPGVPAPARLDQGRPPEPQP